MISCFAFGHLCSSLFAGSRLLNDQVRESKSRVGVRQNRDVHTRQLPNSCFAFGHLCSSLFAGSRLLNDQSKSRVGVRQNRDVHTRQLPNSCFAFGHLCSSLFAGSRLLNDQERARAEWVCDKTEMCTPGNYQTVALPLGISALRSLPALDY
ncbi:hypothetical protein BX666DRAFT_1877372 [Dichotomocladium elegans]|nr:hypothetical protein BX666DRAFT_1877372 [Dichotomocladium elegans]